MIQHGEAIEANIESKSGAGATLSATLYLRSGAAGTVERRQAALRDRFEGIRQSNALDAGTVERWANSIVTPVADNEPDAAAAVAVFRELEAAIEAAGGRLQPFFERQTRHGGLLVGEPDGQRLTFPVACLVVRREGEVTGLYPCRLEGTHHSLEDGLAALEAGNAENLR